MRGNVKEYKQLLGAINTCRTKLIHGQCPARLRAHYGRQLIRAEADMAAYAKRVTG